MDRENAETRRKLKSIDTIQEFEDILNNVMLSEEDKKILVLHYKEQKNMQYIADELGLSEITVIKKHKNILKRVNKYFKEHL